MQVKSHMYLRNLIEDRVEASTPAWKLMQLSGWEICMTWVTILVGEREVSKFKMYWRVELTGLGHGLDSVIVWTRSLSRADALTCPGRTSGWVGGLPFSQVQKAWRERGFGGGDGG